LLPDATRDGQDPGAARKGECGDIFDPRGFGKCAIGFGDLGIRYPRARVESIL
jgi:hypothetical protein